MSEKVSLLDLYPNLLPDEMVPHRQESDQTLRAIVLAAIAERLRLCDRATLEDEMAAVENGYEIRVPFVAEERPANTSRSSRAG